MPTLADIYSYIDTQKRKAAGAIRSPLSTLQEMAALAGDEARQINRETALSSQGRRQEIAGQPMSPEQESARLALVERAGEAAFGGMTKYRGSHTAPNAATYGATLDDLTKILPADVYSQTGKQLYGIGDRLIDSEWRIAALKARNKPDELITIYRAVPKGVKDINSGDWVTTSPTYAKWHGENVLDGEYQIVKRSVPAKTLSTEGYPYEFGYHEK